jgi:hypothetical protein
MKTLSAAVAFSMIGLALALAAPAEATTSSKSSKHKKVAHATVRGQTAAAPGFQGGVRSGPLYLGQDYLGDDPDPNVRAYLLKDMSRYQGSY